MTATLLVRGFEHVIPGLIRLDEDVRAAYVNENRYEMEKVLTEAKKQVPVDTGNLKNSGFLEVQAKSNGVDVSIGFRSDYAVYVHEDLHAKHPGGGNAKFLENPMKRAMRNWDERVAKGVLKALEASAKGSHAHGSAGPDIVPKLAGRKKRKWSEKRLERLLVLNHKAHNQHLKDAKKAEKKLFHNPGPRRKKAP